MKDAMRKRILAVVACAVACACQPFVDVVDVQKLPAAERAAAKRIAVFSLDDAHPVAERLAGPVEAWSCKSMLWDAAASQADATEQVRIKAHRLGANAVIEYACDDVDAPLATNCWSSVRCSGVAVVVARR
jgi:hypothetical protein